MLEEEFLEKKKWAVVGASTNTTKFGYRLYKHLKNKGYTVYAVNPNCDSIEGDRCYANLSSLPEVPEVIDMVVAPAHGAAIIEEAAKLNIRYVWFQPGSCDDALLKTAESHGMQTVQACVLISSR
jgi:predicted CoA-binding protein